VQTIQDYTVAKCKALVQQAANFAVPDIDVKQVRAWTMHAQVADRRGTPDLVHLCLLGF
jgi:hypothetical protein